MYQIRVGGGNDLYIYMDNCAAAQAHECLLLNDTQQRGLEVQRHLADFIQKDGAGVCQFKLPDISVPLCTSKRPLLIAKELAGDQVPGEGRAVENDKRLVPAGAGIMDGLGEDVLAHTGFTQQKGIAIAAGNATASRSAEII